MRKIKITILFFFIFIVNNLYSFFSPWLPLVQHLNNYFCSRQIEYYKITNINGDNLNFIPINGVTLFPGNELIIKQKGDNPLTTQTLGFAKFLGFFNQTGSAQILYKLNQITPGDYLLKPYVRKVVVFTNVKNKYSFKPYNDLVQALTYYGFNVFEIDKPQDISILKMNEYNILVRLDYSNGIITAKIQSLYDRSILFSQSYQFPYRIATNYPPNVSICFKQFKPQGVSRFYANREEIYVNNKNGNYGFTHGNIFGGKKFRESYAVSRYRLPQTAVRMVVADVDGDGKDEFVTLNNYGIYIYKPLGEERLKLFKTFTFRKTDIIAIHLHKGDFNNNGRAELFVTLTQKVNYLDQTDNRLCSMILEMDNRGKFKVLNKDLRYYLRVVEDINGNLHLLCQKEGEYEPYDGPIYEMYWDGKKFRVGKPYPPAKNVYSIYCFNPNPDNKDYLLILDRFGNIAGYYAPTEKKVELLDENLGIYNVIEYPIKLREEEYRGGYNKVTYRMIRAYRRFVYKREYNQQVFTIKTPSPKDITRKLLFKVIKGNEEPDRIIGVKWTKYGIVKSWESRGFYETIEDFDFIHTPTKDSIAILSVDKEGQYWIRILE